MPMVRIPVHVSDSTNHMVVTPPVPKWKDEENGIRATDRETGAELVTLTLVVMEEGRAETMKITVAKNALPNGLHPGRYVRPVKLVATPWARIFNNQLQDGVAYRCESLELVEAPAISEAPQEIAA
ncbi:hypothetical protein [Streptomyces sp. NRRL S-378]|uniref:SCO3933 family regulatory protein n=1 Tax=Streptomyces sp. NRRL S-378 TaxID=1463904 RepID=UPI000690347B|nr:hypothetical protein [Streptomyces sp. NRRL S-378]